MHLHHLLYLVAASCLAVVGLVPAAGPQAPANNEVTAVGRAAAKPGLSDAQARLMAQRGARVTAMRNLARQVFGENVQLDATGTGTAEMDVLLKGAREVSSHPVDDSAYEVTVAIDVEQLGQNLAAVWKQNQAMAADKARIQNELSQAKAQLAAANRANQELTADNQRLVQLTNDAEAALQAARARIAALEAQRAVPAGQP